MALDVVERMNAFVGADRNAARRGDARHAGKIVGMDRLLEEAQAAIADGADVTLALLCAKALISVDRDQRVAAERLADRARARSVGLERIDADF